MARPSPKLPLLPFHQLRPGQPADCFALLADRTRGTTRDGKPFFTCRFRDKLRTLDSKIWADHPLFSDCDSDWQAGQFYKIRAVYTESDRYGPQLEIQQLRPILESDRAEGFQERDFFEASRFDPEALIAELRHLAETEIADTPLQSLVIHLLDEHADNLKQLPAHPRAYFPYPGGWLEHTVSVTRSALLLADRYRLLYPELIPPLNRDLVAAGAILHEIGRVAELSPGLPGQPPLPTIPGQLFGHFFLGRDLVREAAKAFPDLNPELLMLLEHLIVTHLSRPEWGSPRLPAIPEVLILHHADDLDAKFEMYARCLHRDTSEGPFTDPDPVLKKPLLKQRNV